MGSNTVQVRVRFLHLSRVWFLHFSQYVGMILRKKNYFFIIVIVHPMKTAISFLLGIDALLKC